MKTSGSVRLGFVVVTLSSLAAIIGLTAVFIVKQPDSEAKKAEAVSTSAMQSAVEAQGPIPRDEPRRDPEVRVEREQQIPPQLPVVVPAAPVAAPVAQPVTAESRAAMESIWHMDPNLAPMTEARAAEWRQNLEYLVQGGLSSVPALAEFLRVNQDRVFSPADAAMLGYGSVRTAVFDVLGRIGGQPALDILGEVLQTTASPREIALLAKNLETLAPEQYRNAAVDAARQALAMAGQKQMQGYDVAPLFEVMQKYGGAEIAGDLERVASQWNYYATLSLANLPDGAGVPSLIRLAQPEQQNPSRLQALQVLSQMAATSTEAKNALMEQVRANQISNNFWPYLRGPLTGDQLHVEDSVLNEKQASLLADVSSRGQVSGGAQNFFYAPPEEALTPEQINRRLEFLGEIASVTSNAEGLRVLQEAQALLSKRLAGQSNGQ